MNGWREDPYAKLALRKSYPGTINYVNSVYLLKNEPTAMKITQNKLFKHSFPQNSHNSKALSTLNSELPASDSEI